MRDEYWMGQCLELAKKGEGNTSPNPIVGAVVLDKGGQLVGQGYHQKAGQDHAEKIALAEAGLKSKGGTLYVNLEPCNHRKNRRTTPCAPVVFASGVKRVVFGQVDPIASHSGGGRWLKRKGIEVKSRVLEAQCKEANRAFTTMAQEQRPLYVLKVAASLDGKIATCSGESKWITGATARAHGRALRGKLAGILVGIDTVLHDNPRLTARGTKRQDPVRVVLDTRLRTPLDSLLLPANTKSKAITIIATGETSFRTRQTRLESKGAEIIRLPRSEHGLCLESLSKALVGYGLHSVLVEGGAKVHGAFVAAGLCDELKLYLAPKAIGEDGKSWFGGQGIESLAKAYHLKWHGQPETLGNDVLLCARPA